MGVESVSERKIGPALWRPRFVAHERSAARVFMGLLILYVLVRGVVSAAGKLFWLDELLTLTVARQTTMGDMWKVIWRGFDVQPPFFYLIERVMLNLPIKREI